MENNIKKSFYVFLSSLLGIMLFLVLHRLVMFIYLVLLQTNYDRFSFGMSFLDLLALDYFTVILVLLAGAWYGIWLGIHWYEVVYEHGEHRGALDYLICRVWPAKQYKAGDIKSKISAVTNRLEHDLWELEGTVKRMPTGLRSVVPVARKAVKKRVAKTSKVTK